MTPSEQVAATVRSDADAAGLHAQIQHLSARIEELEAERTAAEAFAALAAHEVMAPLVLTEAVVTMAAGRASTPELQESLEVLGRTASRTRRLVEVLLHDARSNSRPPRLRPVDLTHLTADCLVVLRHEIEAQDARVEVEPLPEVLAAPESMNALLTNLLLNALKFAPRRGSAIRVGADREDAGWRIFVDSEGPPVPVADRERIFEPYQRGRGERRIRGAGLGLAICRRVVERHGGRIGVVPTATGDGNRFWFTLPDA